MDTVVILSSEQELKLKVLRAIDAPISRLTVETICNKCGISRRTFYRYFESKQDIWYWYSDLGDDLFTNKIGRSLSWEEGFTGLFSFLDREKDFLALAAGGSEFARPVLWRKHASRRQTIRDTIQEYNSLPITEDLGFLIDIHVWNEINAVYTGFNTYQDLKPIQVAEYCLNLIPEALVTAMPPKR